VERLLHVHRRDVDVVLPARPLLGDHEPVAGRVAGEAADHEVHARGQADACPADVDHLAVRDELPEQPLQLAAALLVEVETADELAEGDRLALAREVVEYAVVERSQEIYAA
jgi:hypothetical protein